MDWKDELFEERNLWRVWRRSPGLASNTFNLWVALLAFLAVLAYVILHAHFFNRNVDASIEHLNSVSELGLGFSSAMLGFLIAGFAIFASISKPRLFVDLAKLPSGRDDLSWLKFVFFSFMNVFIHFLLFIALCAAVQLLVRSGAPEMVKGRQMTSFWLALSHIGLVALGTWFIILLLKLKSFVWNVYQTMLLTIAHEGQRLEEEREGEK